MNSIERNRVERSSNEFIGKDQFTLVLHDWYVTLVILHTTYIEQFLIHTCLW